MSCQVTTLRKLTKQGYTTHFILHILYYRSYMMYVLVPCGLRTPNNGASLFPELPKPLLMDSRMEYSICYRVYMVCGIWFPELPKTLN